MSFFPPYIHKLLYGALVLGMIEVLVYDCDGCSCKGGGLERFPPREAMKYELLENEFSERASLEELTNYSVL